MNTDQMPQTHTHTSERPPAPNPAPSHRMSYTRWILPRALSGYLVVLVAVCLAVILLLSAILIGGRHTFFSERPNSTDTTPDSTQKEGDYPFADGKAGNALIPYAPIGSDMSTLSLDATHAVIADLAEGEIIASKGANERMYPASMTKVMTLIVVVENLPTAESLQDTVTISQAVFNQMTAAGSSGIGFAAGEKVTVEALLYALMLKSDGIAACELARYVADSEANFVKLMNDKAAEMGLTGTHFENPTGLHHEDHVSTVQDIASMMAYAMDMQLCRRIMIAESYTAPCTGADGKQFNYNIYHNLLVTRFGNTTPNQPKKLTVIAGKTGYTPESGYCLVTYAESSDGKGFVCVTAGNKNYDACIADYISIYNSFDR